MPVWWKGGALYLSDQWGKKWQVKNTTIKNNWNAWTLHQRNTEHDGSCWLSTTGQSSCWYTLPPIQGDLIKKGSRQYSIVCVRHTAVSQCTETWYIICKIILIWDVYIFLIFFFSNVFLYFSHTCVPLSRGYACPQGDVLGERGW